MIRVELEEFVSRPPIEVFAYISNFENNPKWQSGMVSATFTSEGPLGVGSTYEQQATFLGRPVESTFEVIAYEPGRMVKATSTSGTFPITFTRIVEPHDGGSRVQAIVEGEAAGFFRLAKPLLNWMVRRTIRADYRTLKKMLEQ